MMNIVSKKAKFLGMMMAIAIGSVNSIESFASDSMDKEIVTEDVKLSQRTYIKALEDLNVYDSVDANKIIGSIKETRELPLNCLWDEGFYEVEYNNGIGFVECNKCSTVLRYDAVDMVEIMNDTTLYRDEKSNIELNKQDVGMLLQTIGSWSMVKVDDNIGYVKSSDTRLLTNVFVVIDKSEQNLYLYQGGNLLLEAPVITGRDGLETDTGDFNVYEKARNYTMRGVDKKTGKRYESFAKYVTKFNKEAFEYIHDAKWRSKKEFKKRKLIRKDRGSHGCANAEDETAKTVFETCNIGDDVIVRP